MVAGEGRRDDEPLVLLVDDDVHLLQIAEIVLEQEDFRVVTAPDGRRALEALEVVEPDVIVTDMMMPEMDGLSFLEEYARRPGPHAPVVAVSGFEAYLAKARELGATAALLKPYDSRDLIEIVQALSAGRAARERPAPPTPLEDETARVHAVLNLRLDDPAPEEGLQQFLDDVAELFDVPISGISAVTEDRHRLVVQCSAAPTDPGGPKEHAFCTHAVAARSALVIQDAAKNPFFRDNPSVTERGFRFYAGVPLVAAHGEAVGTLCVLDYEPHHFTYPDLELLGLCAKRVLAALDLRDKRQRPSTPNAAYRYLGCVDEPLQIHGKDLFVDLAVVELSRSIHRRQPIALAAVAVKPDRLADTVAALRGAITGNIIGRLGLGRLGAVVPGKTAAEAERLVTRAVGDDADVVTVDLISYQGAADLALVHAEQALGDAGLE